jgi:hypothetical protein
MQKYNNFDTVITRHKADNTDRRMSPFYAGLADFRQADKSTRLHHPYQGRDNNAFTKAITWFISDGWVCNYSACWWIQLQRSAPLTMCAAHRRPRLVGVL